MSKILVVEDEFDIRDLIEQVLVIEGYEVTTATNGKEGIEIAKNLLPDLIVCDVNMPEMDGFGLLQNLRKDKSTGTIPFIFLTARADKKDIRDGMNLGADDYLNKPFTIEELKQSIEARLAKSRIAEEAANDKLEELRTNISMSLPHELKTPLNGIIGFAEILGNDIDSLEKEEIVQMSKLLLDDAHRLNKTIEKYLLFSHLQFLNFNHGKLGQIKFASSKISSEFINEVGAPKAGKLERSNDLVINIEPGELKIHEDYLKILVEQLISNCFDYSEKGTVVSVEGKSNGLDYELIFKDNGRGMSDKQLEAIGAFMQFDRNIYEQQGTGMGLIISKQITNIFDGSFYISSSNGNGTSVITTFKLAQ